MKRKYRKPTDRLTQKEINQAIRDMPKALRNDPFYQNLYVEKALTKKYGYAYNYNQDRGAMGKIWDILTHKKKLVIK